MQPIQFDVAREGLHHLHRKTIDDFSSLQNAIVKMSVLMEEFFNFQREQGRFPKLNYFLPHNNDADGKYIRDLCPGGLASEYIQNAQRKFLKYLNLFFAACGHKTSNKFFSKGQAMTQMHIWIEEYLNKKRVPETVANESLDYFFVHLGGKEPLKDLEGFNELNETVRGALDGATVGLCFLVLSE